ncbi:MAG: M1 family metallopeptidase, partial [Flavobacteriales bacterium]
LPFGDYKVSITVPTDHVVASTGTLTNASRVLTSTQRARLAKAEKSFDDPVIIVTQDEAIEAEQNKAKSTKTWVFEAENVRDFAFATSRKFIWDAQAVDINGKTTMAMSYYPKEGNPLWEQYSTRVVAHTLKVYSKFTVDYPYEKAISVHTKWIGMEYPMICFNGGRPEADGTYSEGTKYGMIGVIIHEVGHNFFPMIINSDERQWTWMDEGLNTFCQYLAEQEWDRNYPSRRGPARNITNYMKGDKSNISPIMTNSESVYQFGNNAYGKPATALNILRETVMGRELFDFAFKQYCERWAFHHPTPADFFRSMEDASSVDLDWFWRGWFYTNDHCDMAIDGVKWYQPNSQDPDVEADFRRERDANTPADVTDERNEGRETYLEQDSTLHDYYTQRDKYEVLKLDKDEYNEMLKGMDADDRAMLADGKNYYQVDIRRIGGLVMPVIVEFELENGERIRHHIPAEIWKMDDEVVSKVFVTPMPAVRIVLDPNLETADTDNTNNAWPPRPEPSRFELYKERQGRRGGGGGENPMQRAIRSGELKK